MAIKNIEVDLNIDGDVTADAHVTVGGTLSQFVKGTGALQLPSAINLSDFNDDLVYNNYVLPVATTTLLGGIKLESDTVGNAANPITSTASRTYGLQVNSDGQGVINVPWESGVVSIVAGDGINISGTTAVTINAEGLERVTDTNTGWRLIGESAADHGNIGIDAVDMTISTDAGSSYGAIGNYSFTAGLNTVVSNEGAAALGKWNQDKANSLFLVGMGLSNLNPQNAFEVYDGGEVVAPNVTIAEIDGYSTGRILVTREWVADQGYGSGIVTSLTTTGTSGAATLISGVLNIPNYSGTTYTASDGVKILSSNIEFDYPNMTPATPPNLPTDLMAYYDSDAGRHVVDNMGDINLGAFNNNLGWNNYVHPSYNGDDFSVDTGPLTGATVVSDIDINVTTDTSGHVVDANGVVSTRTLTLGDLGYTGWTAKSGTGVTSVVVGNDQSLHFKSGTFVGTVLSDTTDPDYVMDIDLSATGTPSATTYLRGDNSWATPPNDDNYLSGLSYTASTSILTATLTGGLGSVSVDLSNSIRADALAVTGNGTTAQYLRSDGDGTFTWATPTDTTANETITLSGQVSGSGTNAITTALTNTAISGQTTALTSGLVGTDELLISDAGVLKRMDVSVMNAYFNANLNFGSGDGIVESLTTTGTSGAATLIGGVLNVPNYATGSTPNDATITLSAGTGLTTGGAFTTDQATNETITFNVGQSNGISVEANAVGVDYGDKTPANNVIVAADIANVSSLPAPTPSGTDSIIFNVTSSGLVFQKTFGLIPLSIFDNTASGFISGNQTITLSGDVTGSGTTSITTNIASSVVGATELKVTGNGTTSQWLRSDGDGTFTWAAPPNDYINSASWNSSTGLLTLGGTGSAGATAAITNLETYLNANLNFGTGTMSSWIIKDGDTTTTTVTNGETLTIADNHFIVSNLTSTTSGGTITLSVNYATTNAWTRSQFFSATTANGSGANFAWDCDRDQVRVVTLTGNITTFDAPDTGTHNAGGVYTLIIKQSGANTYTITNWASTYKWPGGVAPTITTGAGAVDVITFISDGTNMYGTVAQDFS